MARTFEVTVRFAVLVPDDVGADGLNPDGVYARLGHIAFIDGAGDGGGVVADEADVVAYTTVSVTEVGTG